MADLTFVDGNTVIPASWLNDINDAAYTGLGITAGTGVINKVQFPATQVASADANALDDYEEGTWTPTDQSGAGLTFSNSLGFYTKIGRIVFWQLQVTFPATADGTTNLIGGLPFTVTGGAQAQGRAGAFVSTSSDANTVGARHIEASTTLRVFKASAAGHTNAELSTDTLYLGGFFVV